MESVEGTSSAITPKRRRNKGSVDCTRGLSREQRYINRSNSIRSAPLKRSRKDICMSRLLKTLENRIKFEAQLDADEDKRCATEEQLFYPLPDRVVSERIYEEKPFGFPVAVGEEYYRPSAKDAIDLSSIIVSLALFDGDKMLFACSGIPLPPGKTFLRLTRFVTSARLVDEFNANRNKDDKLRVEVRLPNNKTIDGFLGLYDRDIAIVTSIGLQHFNPVRLDRQETHCNPDDQIMAFGRAFKTGKLMAVCGSPCGECPRTWLADSDLTEAALGGALIRDGKFLGMIHDLQRPKWSDPSPDPAQEGATCTGLPFIHDLQSYSVQQCALILPQELLFERLEHFQILNPKKLHFREYSLPENVSSIFPSGFIKIIRRLKSNGYPLPPPLVLEFNGHLLNQFEDYFGDLRAWVGYPFGAPPGDPKEYVWGRLKKRVASRISRRVVSLASFNGHERSFACTGWLIKWYGSVNRKSTVILTSASLVRSRYNEDEIDNSLMIKVLLPPSQRGEGTLEYFDLSYNIAVVSVEKSLCRICPEDLYNFSKARESPRAVIAIGRDVEDGLLMASSGVVKPDMDSELDCTDLCLSTCKINKAGIGGPLITFGGSSVGMNFYDGKKVTPFLPICVILKALSEVMKLPLPSERGCGPFDINYAGGSANRWPVPKPYWYHGELDVDRYYVPKLPGRVLQ